MVGQGGAVPAEAFAANEHMLGAGDERHAFRTALNQVRDSHIGRVGVVCHNLRHVDFLRCAVEQHQRHVVLFNSVNMSEFVGCLRERHNHSVNSVVKETIHVLHLFNHIFVRRADENLIAQLVCNLLNSLNHSGIEEADNLRHNHAD